MFYIRMAFTGFWRYRARTFLHLTVCASAVLFLGIYAGNLEGSQNQLSHLAEKIPVEATVINLSGGMESGLFIKEKLYDGIMKSKHIKDPLFTLQLTGMMDEQEYTLLAMTSFKNYESLFSSNEKACVITSELSETQGLKEKDRLTLDLKYYKLDTESHLFAEILPLGQVSYEIAGIADTDTAPADIMIPMETARDSYRNLDIPFYVSSGTFRAKNPLALNTFKKEMEDIGFLEVIPQAQPALEGFALTVKDETFIRAARSVREGYRTMQMFFPVICISLSGAGIITSFLLNTGRQEEYKIRRLLGMPHADCLAVSLAEQGGTELLGGMAGCVAVILLTDISPRLAIICWGIFFIFFFAGSLLASRIFKKTILF